MTLNTHLTFQLDKSYQLQYPATHCITIESIFDVGKEVKEQRDT